MDRLTRKEVNGMINHITRALKGTSEQSYRLAYIAMEIDKAKRMRSALKRLAEILKKQEEKSC